MLRAVAGLLAGATGALVGPHSGDHVDEDDPDPGYYDSDFFDDYNDR